MNDIDQAAEIIWDYHHVKQVLKKCNVILVLCSIDTRVADYAAELFNKGYGKWLVFSGGEAHGDDLLKVSWQGSEAERFAEIAMRRRVPKDKILIEDKATNTGENITFSYQLMNSKNIQADSLLLVQKPYMERRTYATFKKQWPDAHTEFVVSSPPIKYTEYFNETNPKDIVINIMVGDLQRIKEYPKLGFQIEQDIPDEVWAAYKVLVAAGYTKHLIRS